MQIVAEIRLAPVFVNVKTCHIRGVLTVALVRRTEKALSRISEREQCKERADAYHTVRLSSGSRAHTTFTRLHFTKRECIAFDV